MKVALRLIGLALVALVLLVVGFSWWGPAIWESSRAQLAARGIELIGPERVSRQGRTLILHGMGLGTGLRVESLALTFASPWQGDFYSRPLRQVELSDFTLRLAEDRDGQWYLPGLARPSAKVEPGAQAVVDPGQPTGESAEGSGDTLPQALLPLAWQTRLPALSLTGGTVILPPSAGEFSFRVGALTFDPMPTAAELSLSGGFLLAEPEAGWQAGGQVELALNPAPGFNALETAHLQVTDLHFKISDPDFPLELEVAVVKLALAGLGFNPATTRLTVAEGTLRVEQLLAEWSAATGEASAPARLQVPDLELQVVDLGADLTATAMELGRLQLTAAARLLAPPLTRPVELALEAASTVAPTPATNLRLQANCPIVTTPLAEVALQSEMALGVLVDQLLAGLEAVPLVLTAAIQLPPWLELLGVDPELLGLSEVAAGELLASWELRPSRAGVVGQGDWSGYLAAPELLARWSWRSLLDLTAETAELALTAIEPEQALLRLDLRKWPLPQAGAEDQPLPRSPEQPGQWLDGIVELHAESAAEPFFSWRRTVGDSEQVAAALALRFPYPLQYRDGQREEWNLSAAGGLALELAGDPQAGLRWELRPALALEAIIDELAALVLHLGGRAVGELGVATGEAILAATTELLVSVEGSVDDAVLLRPARFRLGALPEQELLRHSAASTNLALALVSRGPRLDLDLAGTRMVARGEVLSLSVAGRLEENLQLDLQLQELLFPGLLLAANDIRLQARRSAPDSLPAAFNLELGRFRDASRPARFAPLGGNLALREEDGHWRGGGDLRLGVDQERPLSLALTVDIAADGRAGRLEWHNHQLEVGGAGLDLRRLLPPLSGEIPEFMGRLRLGGKLFWDDEQALPFSVDQHLGISDFQISLTPRAWLEDGEIKLVGGHIVLQLAGELGEPEALALTTHLDAVTIIAPQAAVYGLEGLDLRIQPLLPPHTPQPLTLRFDELSGFLPFERGRLRFSLEEGRLVHLHGLEMYLGDGRVAARPLSVALAEPAGVLHLDVDGVQLARLNEKLQIELRESLEVEGILDGVLPIHFSAAGVRLVDAELAARGPGIMRYRPGDPTDWLQKTGKSTMQLALSNYRFDTFRLGMRGGLGELLTIDLHTAGTNRDLLWGMPVDLKLLIHADLEKLLSAYSGSVGHAERTYVILD